MISCLVTDNIFLRFFLQSFMFGDFDDLTPDEHQRVHHILHGYKEPSEKRVEVSLYETGDFLHF